MRTLSPIKSIICNYLKRSVIVLERREMKKKFGCGRTDLREKDGSETEKRPIPAIFPEFCELGQLVVVVDMIDRGDIFFLARRSLGGGGEK